MSNILRYKSIVAVCLCFIFVFSFFALTFQRSEAIATIPLVAVPIIKLLIASGVTFLSVDAMLEVYNQIKGTTYYNTLTGNILNVLDDLSEDLVSSWLFHDWAMQQPDPPGSGWPEWPELLLGTLCLEIAKSDNFFQDFLNWFAGFKDDIIVDIINQSLPENIFPYPYNTVTYRPFSDGWAHVCTSCDNPYYYGGRYTGALNVPTGTLIQYFYFYDKGTWRESTSIKTDGNHMGYPDKYDLQINHTVYVYNSDPPEIFMFGGALDLSFLSAFAVEFGLNLNDYLPEEIIDIEIEEMEISDDNFQNDEKEKVEIYVPIPNEIITYDPDTGLDIDFDTEISIEEFTELMTPYVGSTWEDIQQDKPIPAKIPTDVPYPEDPVVPDPVVPPAPAPDEDDLPPDAGEGDDPFAGADEGKTIDWDPLKGIGLHKKFPFCIPWDLYNSFRTFNVEGEAPRWEVEFLGDTEFVIDFVQFEEWARIVRWGVLILFNLGLILITRNIIRG